MKTNPNHPSLVAAAGLTLVFSAAALAGVANVKVTADRSIDCSSMQTIARDLYRDCRTDEAKAIATWRFVRRTQFHWPKPPTWDSMDMVNIYGCSLCGQQSRLFAEICDAGGLKARTVQCKGHVIAEAFYDDAWHMYDCHIGWYALRKDKSAVASCAEMRADPSIITDAVKDGRASQPFIACGDPVWVIGGAVNTSQPAGLVPASKKQFVINLRRGESLTRYWGIEGEPVLFPGETKWVYPYHTCPPKYDLADPVNAPFWQPYALAKPAVTDGQQIIPAGVMRYLGTGQIVYEPDLASAGLAQDLGERGLANLTRGQAGELKLRPTRPGVGASLSIHMDCPYKIVDAWADAEFFRRTEADSATINALPRDHWQTPLWTADKTGRVKAERVSLREATRSWIPNGAFDVRVDLQAAKDVKDVGLESLRITVVFLCNFQSLPYLLPGENAVEVTAAEDADLEANRLTVKHAWEEDGKPKTLSKRVSSVPFETPVEVPGTSTCRMKSVTLSVDP